MIIEQDSVIKHQCQIEKCKEKNTEIYCFVCEKFLCEKHAKKDKCKYEKIKDDNE